MSREKSKPLQVLERLLAVLEEDVALHPELWLTAPPTMTIQPTAATKEEPRPMIAFVRNTIETVDTGMTDAGLIHRSVMSVTVFMETSDVTDPQAAAEELASDFFRFVGRHQQLEGDDGEAFVDCGQMKWLSDETFLDLQEGGAGGAVIEAKLAIEFYRATSNG